VNVSYLIHTDRRAGSDTSRPLASLPLSIAAGTPYPVNRTLPWSESLPLSGMTHAIPRYSR